MQKIYSTDDKVFIYLLKSKLEDKGISSFIKNETPPLLGEIPSIIAWPELWIVNNDQMATAEKIIAEEINKEDKVKKPWTCPTCGEVMEGQFEVCWKCGK